jgi:hypothetical protein
MPSARTRLPTVGCRRMAVGDEVNSHPLDDLPADVGHLLELVYSLIMVAMCVEIWHQPKVIDSAWGSLDRVADPVSPGGMERRQRL